MPAPSVSVLLAVHNGERHLPEALDTLLAQTFDDFELVAVDDGSTDGTGTALDAYAARDGRVRVVRLAENAGLPAALNRGLGLCRAGLVARADADDTYHPERLARQVAFLRAHPDVGLVGCWYRRVAEDGTPRGTSRPPTDDATIRARQLFVNSFLHPGVMFRAGVVRAVGGYDERYWTAQDADLWVRLRDHTRFANVPEALVTYRTHRETISRTRGEAGQRLSAMVSRHLLSELLRRPLSDDEVVAVVSLYRSWERAAPGTVGVGRPLLREALREVERTEPPHVARWMRREAADSLLLEARPRRQPDRALGRALLSDAVRFNPRLLFSRRAASVVCRHVVRR
jgi:glycosyltransferase involved in cell wall biosynthesis